MQAKVNGCILTGRKGGHIVTSRLRLTGHERLYGSNAVPGDAMILDFWRWAFSNLQMDDVRGIFAEWMVAKLLGIPTKVRGVWDAYDLIAPNGVRIKVKAAAYLQSWTQGARLSQIVFSGLKGHQRNAQAHPYAEAATYHADLYVFCVQVKKKPEGWDALDLAQWRFYTVTGAEIALLGKKNISLGKLRRLCTEMRAEMFRVEAMQLIQALGQPYNARV